MIFIERKWKKKEYSILYSFSYHIPKGVHKKKKSGGKIQLISINRKQKNIAECFGI